MSEEKPLVTVVALCYNHSRYVIETLESIRHQIYSNLEVIIVDDCSKDDSVEVVTNWLAEHAAEWQFIRHKQNYGVCKSLNETLLLAQGKYYKAIACDDVLLPHFISTMVDRFEQLPEDYAMIYSDVLTMDEHSQDYGTTPFTERGWDTEEKVPSGKLFDQLAGWCFIPAPGTFLRTRVLQEIRFDESLFYEDWDMWLSIAKLYRIKGIVEQLVKYRVHRSSMYQQASKAFIQSSLLIAEKHLGFSNAADKKLKEFIIQWSLKNYLKGGEKQSYWLWKRFVFKKSIKNLYKCLRAILS